MQARGTCKKTIYKPIVQLSNNPVVQLILSLGIVNRWSTEIILKNEPVVDLLLVVDPQPGQLGEHVDDLEGLEVVDEDVGHPKVVDQLQVH